MVITGLVALLTVYVSPVALVFFAKKGNFGAAFELGKVFKKAFTGTYLVAWIAAIAYAIVVLIIAWLLSFVLAVTIILPIIINAAAMAILVITWMTLLGQAVEEA